MKLPKSAVRYAIDRVIESRDTSSLAEAFVWRETDQGHEFWAAEKRAGVLSESGLAALKDIHEGLYGGTK